MNVIYDLCNDLAHLFPRLLEARETREHAKVRDLEKLE